MIHYLLIAIEEAMKESSLQLHAVRQLEWIQKD